LNFLPRLFCSVLNYTSSLTERFSIECRKTNAKPITYQLDYSANLKRLLNQYQNQSNCLITFDAQLKTALSKKE